MKEKSSTFKIWKKWLFWNRTFWLTDVGNEQAIEFHPLWWTPVSLWVLRPFWTMFYLPIAPGSRWHRCELGIFGLGYVTHSWPGRWCSPSSCNFPSMQTRSQMPGGSSDRSTWERLISQGRVRAFSSAKSVHTILLAHVGEAVSFVPQMSWDTLQAIALGMPFLPCMAQEARSFLCPARPSEVRTQGHQRGSACSGLGVAPATPDFWLAGAKCDRGEWPEGVSFPRDSEHGLPSWSHQGTLWSGHSRDIYSLWILLTCPVLALREQSHRIDN